MYLSKSIVWSMKINLKQILVITLLILSLESFSQKWYYHSMKGKMALCDTSKNIAEIEKSNEVFMRVLVSRPNDTLALYYHVFAKCLKYFYTNTSIYKDEQQKMYNELKQLDSIIINKDEIYILQAFVDILCNHVDYPQGIWGNVASLRTKYPNNCRVQFVDLLLQVKYKKITKEELTKQIQLISEKNSSYQVSDDLKINWGIHQLKYLTKLF